MSSIFKMLIFIAISYFLFDFFLGDKSATTSVQNAVTTRIQKTVDDVAVADDPTSPSNPFASVTPLADDPHFNDYDPANQPPATAQEEASSGLTRPQSHAVRSAKEYIAMTGFSRNGLIEQLSSEYGSGYSIEDATAAVDSLDLDYSEQATRTAKTYLKMTGFSCTNLINQLSMEEGDKYTDSQATFGATQAGACS